MKFNLITALVTKSKAFLVGTLLLCLSCQAFAFEHEHSLENRGGEETILVESKPGAHVSYRNLIKSLSKEALGFYIGSLLSGGKNYRDSFIRNFHELADRAKYKLNVKQEKIELRLTLNF